MNLLFDASVIGLSRMEENCRTGVFRYTEGLLKGLLKHPEIPVSFSVSEGYRPLIHFENYRKQDPSVLEHALLERRPASAAYRFLYHFRPDKEVSAGFITKVRRRAALEGMSWIERHAQVLPEKNLLGFQAYHSPFWPIPEAVRKIQGIKRFLTVHDLYSLKSSDPKDRLNHFEQRLLDSVANDDYIFCVSEATKRDVLEMKPGFNPDHAIVTYEGLDDGVVPVSDRRRDAILQSKGLLKTKYFLSVGSVHERKNTAHLIESFKQWVHTYSDKSTKLVIVGPVLPGYGQELTQTPEVRALQDRIHFFGFLEDEELFALYQGAQAFVYPSLYEGFGIPILEAMRLGCPVIASNTSSIPEVAGDAAILVPTNDCTLLSDALETVSKQSELRSRLIEKGAKQLKKFQWNDCVDKTVGGYLRVFRRKGSA